MSLLPSTPDQPKKLGPPPPMKLRPQGHCYLWTNCGPSQGWREEKKSYCEENIWQGKSPITTNSYPFTDDSPEWKRTVKVTMSNLLEVVAWRPLRLRRFWSSPSLVPSSSAREHFSNLYLTISYARVYCVSAHTVWYRLSTESSIGAGLFWSRTQGDHW